MYQILHYIDGQWHTTHSDNTPLTTFNPATEQSIGYFYSADATAVDQAVAAAQRAFASWSKSTVLERVQWLTTIAEYLEKHKLKLANISHSNNGKPLAEALLDVEDSIACYQYYAELIQSYSFETASNSKYGAYYTSFKQPLGVVGLITAWNFPLVTSAWKIAPALASGCTVILKPSEMVPLPEFEFAKIVEEIQLPKGVINILFGGAETGQLLIQHPHVNKISFTGSTDVGKKILRASADQIKRVTLELGGKSPMIIFPDVNVDDAVEKAIQGIFFNAGQMCSATSRLFVHNDIAIDFYQKLRQRSLDILIQDVAPEKMTMGPISTQPQYVKVKAFLEIAKQEKLAPLVNSDDFKHPESGYFIAPHIFIDVPESSQLWQQEIFGPVLTCQTFQHEEAVIEAANRSCFGLAATVLTGCFAQGQRIAKQLNVGHVWINSIQIIHPDSLWSGHKMSGLGKELGVSGLESYLESSIITHF